MSSIGSLKARHEVLSEIFVVVELVSKKVGSIKVLRLIISESNIEWKRYANNFEYSPISNCPMCNGLRRMPVTLRFEG